MVHTPDHEMTVGELAAGGDLASRMQRIVADTVAAAEASRQRPDDDPFIGGVSEDFAVGAATVPGIRGGEIPAFRQDFLTPGTPATFRRSDLEAIAAWPLEKRSRLILQMQKAGLVSDNMNARWWGPDVTQSLGEALSFANLNGITDPFQAVNVFGSQKAAAEKKAKPTFNFVSREFLPPDPAAIDEEIRGLAKKMFAGTDIELSDEEVAHLRSQFEGLSREQHFAAEQQRLSEEHVGFQAQVAAAEGRNVNLEVDAVPQVDAGARFRELFAERYRPKTDAIDQMGVDDQSRQLTEQSLGRVMQFATGR